MDKITPKKISYLFDVLYGNKHFVIIRSDTNITKELQFSVLYFIFMAFQASNFVIISMIVLLFEFMKTGGVFD
jgi:hypothetical protein